MSTPEPPSPAEIELLLARQAERIGALERQVGRLSAALRSAGIAPPPLPPAEPALVHTPVTTPSVESVASEPTANTAVDTAEPPPIPVPAAEAPSPDPIAATSHAPATIVAAPPPMYETPAASFPSPAMRPFEPGPVVLGEHDFLTQKDVSSKGPTPPPSQHPAAPPPRMDAQGPRPSGAGLEAALAMRLLPIVGGVLLLFGGVFLASLIGAAMPPGGRVALGYLFAALLGGVAVFAHRRSETVGRLVTAIALAFAYLVSFSAHFIPPTKCLGATASLLLMGAFAAAIVAFAEKWRSEGTAIFAFGLGMLAALLSADVAGGFGLLALVIISVGAGVLLVRNEWIRLTIVTLLGCYASYAGLWLLSPPERSAAALNINFAALLVSHAVFTLAFWRWGRPWVARELAFEQMTEHEAAPRVVFGRIPYSTAYSIINSLGFIGLSLYLAWLTNTNSGGADKLFYTLAVIEGARLLVPALRRGGLHSFHGLTAIALATSGLMVTFAGNTESAMLASECLILCIAASRAPMLRILRPFSAICGFLAAREVAYSGFAAADLATALVPGALILLSTISWDSIFVRIVKAPEMGFLFQFERLSSNVRALTACGIIAGVLEGHRSVVPLEVTAPLASALLGAGAILLRARAWTLPFHIGMVATLGAFTKDEMTGQRLVLFSTWGGIMALASAEIARRTRSRLGAFECLAANCVAGIGAFGVAMHVLRDFSPHMGAAGLLLAVSFAAGTMAALTVGPLPAMVQDRFAEVPSHTGNLTGLPRLILLSPGSGMCAGVLAIAGAAAALDDAKSSLTSALLFTAILGVGWFLATAGKKRSPLGEAFLAALLLAVACPALIVFSQFGSVSMLAVIVLLGGVGVAAVARRSPASAGVAALGICAVPLVAQALSAMPGRVVPFSPGPAVLACVLCVALSRAVRSLAARLELESTWAGVPPFVAGWLVVTGSLAFLLLTSTGGTLSATLVTVAWAGYGIALLVAGLVLMDAPMRFTSLAIFACAVVRVFMVDLANANLLVKAVAATGVGVVLILAGVGYGAFRRRMQEQSPDASPPPPEDHGPA